MATKKDLVEAYSFSRRRLVTAFVSGAPGGREVEPTRPGRTIVGGLALAVLMAAGAAIAGVFAPRAPSDWNQPGLVISRETGSAYVILEESDEPELRPVINSTSAKLVLGADAGPTLISQDTIDDQRIGDDIGILGAPASLPTPSLLIDDGWTACTADRRGIDVQVADHPDVTPAPGTGVTVRSGGRYFVVVQPERSGPTEAGAHLYPVPRQRAPGVDQTDNLLTALELEPTRGAVRVPREWLGLFPVGSPLDWTSFGLDGFGGEPDQPLPGDARGARVGDVLVTDSDESLLVTKGGPVEIGGFAEQVYLNVITPDGDVPHTRSVSDAPAVERAVDLLDETDWPDDVPTVLSSSPCAQLVTEEGRSPVVLLAGPGETAGDVDLGAGDIERSVDPGRGAYVLSGGWADTDTGSPFVVDSRGRAHPLVGQGTADLLGYADVPAPVVPDTWVELFACGVELSRDAALSPPTDLGRSACG